MKVSVRASEVAGNIKVHAKKFEQFQKGYAFNERKERSLSTVVAFKKFTYNNVLWGSSVCCVQTFGRLLY